MAVPIDGFRNLFVPLIVRAQSGKGKFGRMSGIER
jgi:hypothetical protein